MKYRSYFWPFFLIAAGIIWVLIEIHTIPLENLWSLLYVWPFLLMAAGVSLVLRSRWPVARVIVSSLTVLGMLVAVIVAPQFGLNNAPSWSYFHLGDFGYFTGSISGSGVVVSENRSLPDFQSIEIDYPVELTIEQGVQSVVTVQAEDNLVPQLATRVSGSTLYIENNQRDWTKRVNPTKPVKIKLTVSDLQRIDFPSAGNLDIVDFSTDRLEISLSGAGSIHVTDLSATSLSTNLSGAGNISASGKVDQLNMHISGLGQFEGAELSSQSADISISGAGGATVWVTSTLNVNISGTGSVNYYGVPSVTRQVSGIGHISGLGEK
jgi:hypothetical protein